MALTLEERFLLQACRKGRDEAWLALYRSYGSDVGLFLKGMLRHSRDIDDLIQKVFIQFLASLDHFRGDAGIRAWLYGIARNVVQHELRSTARRTNCLRAYAEVAAREPCNPEEQALARVQLGELQDVVSELPDSFREVWILRELVGLSATETATALNTEPATVRTRHLRARRRLYELLAQLGGLEQGEQEESERLGFVRSKGALA